MLTVKGQIMHLMSKGVKFDKVSVEDATKYLQENNNYFKLRAYRKNFPKHPNGPKKNQYIDLDFGQLKDLAIIDMRMRYVFLQLALDVEHFAKGHLLHVAEASDDNGYIVVERYFEHLQLLDEEKGTHRYDKLLAEISRNADNPYCGGIIKNYKSNFPVWAFVEIIPMGTFVDFYKYCATYFNDKEMEKRYYLLLTIKQLRNAAAHSNCLIYDMGAKDAPFQPDLYMMKILSAISKAARKNHFRNERMRQIITLIYAHTVFATSEGICEHTHQLLDELVRRMFCNIDLYSNNECILSSFNFFKKAVDIFGDYAYNNSAMKK